MKQCLIIGQTNVGKTAFALSFAEVLGLDKVEVTFTYPDGFSTRQTYTLNIARQELVGPVPHKTRCLQSMSLQLPAGKGHKQAILVDSTGLMEGIHDEDEVRRATAQTLRKIREASLILHIVDAAHIGRQPDSAPVMSEVDRQVASFAQARGIYVLLANKMDLPFAHIGLLRLRALHPNYPIFPVSSLTKTGLKEVRAFVAKRM